MGFQPQISAEQLPGQKSHSGPNCLTGRARGVQVPTGMRGLFKWEQREGTFPFQRFQEMVLTHSRKPAALVPSPCLLSGVVAQADTSRDDH